MTVENKGVRPKSVLRAFFSSNSAGGIVLMVVALAAIIIANSPASGLYFGVLKQYVFGLSVLHWINDALMAVFFLLVGLEIKREFLDGQLSSWSRRALPGFAALGGMVAPALIFVALNSGTPETLRGWAIPAATDIAFALGVLSLLGNRVPGSLKVFLTALAILDDLGAVIIIAIFYTSDLSGQMLGLAFVTLAALAMLNRAGVTRLLPYLLLGLLLWFFVLKSGVHATLAGVALALTIPLTRSPGTPEHGDCALLKLEHALHPYVSFLIIPIFGFANAGVSFAGVGPSALLAPVPLGVTLGLFIGKQIGVFGFGWAAIKLGLADLPARASWLQFYGIALLCGIGFTMSLFIGMLAYPDSQALQDQTKIGVLAGSVISGLLGWVLLRIAKAEAAPQASR